MTVFGMRVDIKIQSISDIITNSSSEVFCKITGNNLGEIWDILQPLFPGTDSELEPVLRYYEDNEWDDGVPEHIILELPYSPESVSEFYKAGLEAILNNLNCNIEYNEEY